MAVLLTIFVSTLLLVSTATSASVQTPAARNCPLGGVGGELPTWGCTNSIDWLGDGYSNSDCVAVVQRLYFVEVAKHSSREFEFLRPGATNKTDLPVMQTPRRYTVGQFNDHNRHGFMF